jgi:hypothetical protein
VICVCVSSALVAAATSTRDRNDYRALADALWPQITSEVDLGWTLVVVDAPENARRAYADDEMTAWVTCNWDADTAARVWCCSFRAEHAVSHSSLMRGLQREGPPKRVLLAAMRDASFHISDVTLRWMRTPSERTGPQLLLGRD